jgi:hypothetical protein
VGRSNITSSHAIILSKRPHLSKYRWGCARLHFPRHQCPVRRSSSQSQTITREAYSSCAPVGQGALSESTADRAASQAPRGRRAALVRSFGESPGRFARRSRGRGYLGNVLSTKTRKNLRPTRIDSRTGQSLWCLHATALTQLFERRFRLRIGISRYPV